ncbi:hypothetical protein [Brachybacterium avium]|uniref:hypothetical protein n=1 Tax=Brachybacterium avium TaxID=2017485 RepID=UPI0012FE52D5|nr:hypothetical protein [Brachybacterium avium]
MRKLVGLRLLSCTLVALSMMVASCVPSTQDDPQSGNSGGPATESRIPELELPAAASDSMPETSELTDSLGCAAVLPIHFDVQSAVSGSGSICIVDLTGGPQLYLMRYESFPTSVLDERIWASGDPVILSILYSDGYIVGSREYVEGIPGGAHIEPSEWKDLSMTISPDRLVPDTVFECRSILSTALASDFRFKAGADANGWVESSVFDYGGGAGTQVIEDARSSLEGGRESELLDLATQHPEIIDYVVESYVSEYGTDVVSACSEQRA